MTTRTRWLCIAYSFPPVNRSGVHRTAALVRHLHKRGWEASVVSGPLDGEPTDDSLITRVPASTQIIRAPWFDLVATMRKTIPSPDVSVPRLDHLAKSRRSMVEFAKEWLSSWLKFPDPRNTWIPPATAAGLREIIRHRPEVLYSTSPCMSAHVVALVLSWATRIPWVADFRDPWVDNPYRDVRFRSVARADCGMESLVLRRAESIICNTERLRQRLCERVPLVASKCRTIANGIDLDLLQGVRPTRPGSAGQFVILHCGQFYGPRRPHFLLQAVRHLMRTAPHLADRLKVVFIGSTYYENVPLEQLVASHGVERSVTVLPTVGHEQTLSYMMGSDALILVGECGQKQALQVPNKLYEYLGVQKPIVAAVIDGSPVVDIIKKARAPAIVCEPQNPTAIAAALTRAMTGAWPPVTNPWSGVTLFDRARRAAELADVFERLSRRRGGIVRRASASIDRAAEMDWSAFRGRSSSLDRDPARPAWNPATS